MRSSGALGSMLVAGLVAAVAGAAVLAGQGTTVEGTSVQLAWPAAGVVGLWALLAHRSRTLPRDAVLLAVVMAAAGLVAGVDLPSAVALSVVDVGQGLLFARVFARLRPAPGGLLLLDVRDLGVLLLTAGLAGTAGALAGAGVAALRSGSWSVLETVVWQSRSAASLLVVVALGLRVRQLLLDRRGVTTDRATLPPDLPTGWRAVELGLAVLASMLGNAVVFWWLPAYPVAFPLFAITAWVALRFDAGLTTLRTVAVSAAAVVFTLHGHGPFAAIDDVQVQALIVQAYVALGAVLGLALALNRDERLVLVDRLRATAVDADQRTRQVQVLARASRAVLLADDPREAVCRAVREATGADGVYLMEPDGDGHLVSTSVVGLDLPPLCFSSDPAASLTARLFTEGRPLFLADLAVEAGISPALVDHLRIASAAWQPAALADDRVVAVIGVIWHTPVAELSETTHQVLAVLGTEAARAIERGNLLEQLVRAADRDPLTGLANRRRWDESVGVEVSRAQRSGLPLTLMMVDLDHFKAYNDTFGHPAGDELLRDFAEAATGCLRDGDLMARWGGEEFVVALPDCTADQARPVAERILAAVPHGQTATVGIARWTPGDPPAATLVRADEALYRGKRAGRARAVVADQPVVVPV